MSRPCFFAVLTLGSTALFEQASATQSSVPFIHADLVHAQGITGRGVTVAVLDTGIDYSLFGEDDVTNGGASFIPGGAVGDGGAAPPGETHGTIVSLIITDSTGVAPNAKT